MNKYFLQHTPLADFEKEMIQPLDFVGEVVERGLNEKEEPYGTTALTGHDEYKEEII